MGGLLQGPVRESRAGAALSLALCASRRHLQLAPGLRRRQKRVLRLEGLPYRWPGAVEDHDARGARVYPPLSDTSSPGASTAFATMGCSPTLIVSPISPVHANSSLPTPTTQPEHEQPAQPGEPQ